MAITLTPRIGLPQWSSGADAPSRATFNSGFLNADGLVAVDTGEVGGSALPTTNLVAGRYAQTVNGNYRALYRRDTAGWKWVGGNTVPETLYHRAEAAAATTAQAQQVSHPSLTNPTIVDNWDGTGVRGGRLALLEQNSGAVAALHIGDASAADLANRGRLFVRTTADGQRGLVLSAHGGGAGLLLSAQSGGSDSTTIDSSGRFRTQVPSAFGSAGFSANVPLSVAGSGTDVSALDTTASANASAQRWFRTSNDTTPIASIAQDRITLGRSSWSGARIDLMSPDNRITGPLSVSGTTSLAALTATTTNVTSLAASSAVSGATVTATGTLSAEGGLVQSTGSGGGTVLSRPSAQYSGSSYASLRQSIVGYTYRVPKLPIGAGSTGQNYDLPVLMPESGWMRLDSVIRVQSDLGASNSIEPMRVNMTFSLLDASGNLIEKGFTHVNSTPTDDTSRQIEGWFSFTITDLFWTRISAGNYTIRLNYTRGSILGGWIDTVRYIVTPVVLANVNSS